MSHPDNWTPRTGAALAAPAVILDLDGVIADTEHRQHFLAGSTNRDKDWAGFFNACADDPVIPAGKALAAAISADITVVVLTARIHEIREETIAWLDTNEIRHDWLIMRGPRGGGPSSDWKRTQLELLREFGADIRLTLDDDPRNIAMMLEMGLTAQYIHSGYYLDQSFDVEFR